MAGLLGGAFAWALTYATYRGVYSYLLEVAWLPTEWIALGLLAGGVFGAIASALAIRRHLKEV
jgi:hypothetical protein